MRLCSVSYCPTSFFSWFISFLFWFVVRGFQFFIFFRQLKGSGSELGRRETNVVKDSNINASKNLNKSFHENQRKDQTTRHVKYHLLKAGSMGFLVNVPQYLDAFYIPIVNREWSHHWNVSHLHSLQALMTISVILLTLMSRLGWLMLHQKIIFSLLPVKSVILLIICTMKTMVTIIVSLISTKLRTTSMLTTRYLVSF